MNLDCRYPGVDSSDDFPSHAGVWLNEKSQSQPQIVRRISPSLLVRLGPTNPLSINQYPGQLGWALFMN
jgi:hypothetical protein